MPVHVSSKCAHQQEVKIALHGLWYHHTYRYDDTIQPVSVHSRLKHVRVHRLYKQILVCMFALVCGITAYI